MRRTMTISEDTELNLSYHEYDIYVYLDEITITLPEYESPSEWDMFRCSLTNLSETYLVVKVGANEFKLLPKDRCEVAGNLRSGFTIYGTIRG